MLRPTTAATAVADLKRWRPVAAALAVLLLFACSAVPAFAGTGHVYVSTIGASGAGTVQFNGIRGIGLVPSNGDLIVADSGNGRIQRITSAGEPVSVWAAAGSGPFGVAVDETNNRVYVTKQTTKVVEVYALGGISTGQLDPGTWGNPAGVAVDPTNGDTYVVDSVNSVVKVYDSTGASIGSFGSAGTGNGQFSTPSAIAVDGTSHDVYVADSTRVQRFTAHGASFVSALSGVISPKALAVDQSNSDVYVGEGSGSSTDIARYDSSGNRLYAFGSGKLLGVAGIAVTSTHRVYATDSGDNTIKVFALTTVPTVTTNPATNVTSSSATLNGTVNPSGLRVTQLAFDYGFTSSYGSRRTLFTTVTGTSNVNRLTSLFGLQPNKTYHFRFGALGPDGWTYGADRSFTTLTAAPAIGDAYGGPVGSTTATIHAPINANNSPTTYYVEYGTTTAYGTATAPQSGGSGYGQQDFTTDLAGLDPDTIYHYHVVADNGTGGPVAGPDETFKTAAAGAPIVVPAAVSATVEGLIDVRGYGTYYLEYGTTTAYGATTMSQVADAVSGGQLASADVDGLQPGTTYHVRLVWQTAGGDTTVSDDATFTTLPAPAVTTGDATDVGTSSATLHGTVDTHGSPGTYRFLVTGVDSSIARQTPDQAITSNGAADVAAAIGDLPDGHTYQVVLEATVGGATVDGAATTFQTATLAASTPRSADTSGNAYGCAAPHLIDPGSRAVAGTAFTLAGSDLGVAGEVRLGNGEKAEINGWSAGAVTFVVPEDASGPLTVSVFCGNVSNSVTVPVAVAPDNTVTVLSARAKRGATRAKVRVRAAGAGALRVSGAFIATAKKTLAKGGTYTVTVRLTRKGRAAVRKSGSLDVPFTVEFTPTGGSTGSDLGEVTFRRKAARRH